MSLRENGDTGSARPSGADRRVRNFLLVGAKLAVSTFVLYLLGSRIDLSQTADRLAGSDKGLWFLAFLLVILTQFLSALRWGILLKPLEFDLPRRRVAAVYFTGMFFSLFLPSVVGGDAVKTWYVARWWRKTPAAVYTLLADRGIGLAAMMGFCLLGALLSWSAIPAALVWTVALFVFALYAGFFLFPHLSGPLLALFKKLREMPRDRLYIYWSRPRPAIEAFLISLPMHLLLVLAHRLMARSLGIEASWGALMLVYPLTALAAMIPVSLNGIGPREAAYVYALALFGVGKEAAGSLALMWFSLVLATGLLGAIPFLWLLWNRRQEGEADKPAGGLEAPGPGGPPAGPGPGGAVG